MDSITTHIDKHRNKDVFVIGAGTSLYKFGFQRLVGQITIVLNDVVKHVSPLIPTYHLFHDLNLFTKFRDLEYAKETLAVCPKTHMAPRAERSVQLYLDNHYHRVLTYWQRGPDIGYHSDELWCNNTIAAAGIEFAWKLGAKRIILLGLDGYAFSNWRYFYDTRPLDIGVPDTSMQYYQFGEDMDQVKKLFDLLQMWPEGGVWNCSRMSTIQSWPKMHIDQVLQ